MEVQKIYAKEDFARIKAKVFPKIKPILDEARERIGRKGLSEIRVLLNERKITIEYPMREALRLYQSEKFNEADAVMKAAGIFPREVGKYGLKMADAKAAEGKYYSAFSVNYVAGNIAYYYGDSELSYKAGVQREEIDRQRKVAELNKGKKSVEYDPAVCC